MSVSIKILDASFDKFVATTVPQQTGLLAWHYLGGTEAKSEKNFVAGGSPSVMVGAPTINAASVEGSPGNAFDTGLLSTAEVTLIALVKKKQTLTNFAVAITNHSGATKHDSLTQTTGGNLRMYAEFGAASINAEVNTTGISDGSWYVAVGVIDSSGVRAKRILSGAVTTVTTAGSGRLANAAGTYALAGQKSGSSPFPQTQEMTFAGIWGRALSDVDLVEVYNWLKARYAGTLTIV